jgi:hypothetical protein
VGKTERQINRCRRKYGYMEMDSLRDHMRLRDDVVQTADTDLGRVWGLLTYLLAFLIACQRGPGFGLIDGDWRA